MSKPDEVRNAYAAAHVALPVELSINCFLIDTGTTCRMLVDTGAGELFGPTSGQLVANLRASGYRPEDIDVILLTHIHGDHSGGLSVGGERVFPNALVYVDRRDPDYWLSAEVEAKTPANRRATFEQSHKTLDPYIDAGKLRTFDGATELSRAMRTVPEHGHTPGLTGYLFESRGQRPPAVGRYRAFRRGAVPQSDAHHRIRCRIPGKRPPRDSAFSAAPRNKAIWWGAPTSRFQGSATFALRRADIVGRPRRIA